MSHIPIAARIAPVFFMGLIVGNASRSDAQEYATVPLTPPPAQVEPMTGIVLWSTNERAATTPIQLEYAYLSYAEVVTGKQQYDFAVVEKLLDEIAARKHQAILRFYDTYVGKPAGIPKYIRELSDYKGIEGKSEGKKTGFPNWAHPEIERFHSDFFRAFAAQYDTDPRIAFVQVGFGLWSEYHIYDGPMTLGGSFPTLDYQARFAKRMSELFQSTPWMISVDAAGEHTPFFNDKSLRQLPFGLFDDSFNHKEHEQQNAPNWQLFGADKWRKQPCGGEFSFFEKIDQSKALAPKGPHGIPFEEHAKRFHVSFIIGDDQPRFQKDNRIREAGMAMGYRFQVTRFESSGKSIRGTIQNVGIAPIYYDAYPAVAGKRASVSLRLLQPEQSLEFQIDTTEQGPFTIECDRLVPGQRIGWSTATPAP